MQKWEAKGRTRRGRSLAVCACAVLLPWGCLAIDPATPVADPDAQLTASVGSRAAAVLRRNADAAVLARAIYPPPVEPPPPAATVTNLPPATVVAAPPTAVTNAPPPPPAYQLTAIYSDATRGRTLARLNDRLVSEGDSAGHNLHVAKIGSDHVVLVDTQGVRRVVFLFGR